MESPTLYIVDGHSQVFKAYHAIQQLSTSKGIPTNAVYGFAQILHKLLKTRTPNYLVVAFDSGGPTFRHGMYAEYKANREAPPEDFPQQMGLIFQVLDGLRIPRVQLPGFEADDIIATIVRRANEAGFRSVVVTADKDLLQLVTENVRVLRLDPDKEIEFDREAVKEKMGVYPERIRDLLAMVGDTSDNVPGIKKVGPKTAAALLDQYGTLEAVLANTAQLKGKQRENVEAGRESALLSQKLVTLDENVPIVFEPGDFERKEPDVAALTELYRELEFRRFLDDLPAALPAHTARYEAVTDAGKLREIANAARSAGLLAVDTETDGLNTITATLIGISLAVEPHVAYYIPIAHTPAAAGSTAQIPLNEVFAILDPLFRDPAVLKIGHHMKFDRKVLMRSGFDFSGPCFDTLLASYLLNPDKRGHGLKDLSADLLHMRMTPISELIGTGKSQITFADVDIGQAVPYAAADADATLQLHALLAPRLDEAGIRELFERVEMPLIEVLMDMELCGVVIDSGHFQQLSREMQEESARISGRVYELVGRSFNLASPRQVAQVLFEELKLPPTKEKKTGFSTDVDVLEELASHHEVARLLLEFRQYEKLNGTYAAVLPGLVEASTGRIHTTYSQTMAATGRLSSSDPNLQNIPVRTALGRKIREGFRPGRPGNLLLSADYSQIELRVLAHVSRDASLVRAFRNDEDVHSLTASKVFGVELGEVSPEMRDQAKVVNFGIIYGISPHGLSQRLKIPADKARRFIEEYFAAYAGVKAWIDGTLEAARSTGFVATVSGRRRYLPDINSRNFNARSAAERVAVNAPIQGSSADMLKIAMIRIHEWLRSSDLRTRMIMTVHDELIFDLPADELPEVEARVREWMESALPLEVPVKVDMGSGTNWAEC